MPQSLETDRIVCEKCRAQYRWKRELVGKHVKCKCGQMIRIDLLSVAPEHYDLAPVPVVPVRPIRERSVPQGIAYRTPQTRPIADLDGYVFDKLKDIQIPVALIGCGTLISFAEVFFDPPPGAQGYRAGFMLIAAGLVITTTILLLGAFAAAKVRGLTFGPFRIALLKLTAIAIAPGAVATLMSLALRPFGFLASLIALVASFLFYFALYGVLFDLDESDTWFCVCVNFILGVLTTLFVIPMIGKMLL